MPRLVQRECSGRSAGERNEGSYPDAMTGESCANCSTPTTPQQSEISS